MADRPVNTLQRDLPRVAPIHRVVEGQVNVLDPGRIEAAVQLISDQSATLCVNRARTYGQDHYDLPLLGWAVPRRRPTLASWMFADQPSSVSLAASSAGE